MPVRTDHGPYGPWRVPGTVLSKLLRRTPALTEWPGPVRFGYAASGVHVIARHRLVAPVTVLTSDAEGPRCPATPGIRVIKV